MLRMITFATVAALWLSIPLRGQESGVADDHPVYVGTQVCTGCHFGADAGYQFSRWRTHPHSQAYASLWNEDSKKIARLSGIPEEPQEAAMCLGCHATAWDTEDWERDDTFRFEDGVQCERCHGPGSEYAHAEIMTDSVKAKANGLQTPTEHDCMMCHKVKGSHVAVLGTPDFDVEAAMERLAHPIPRRGGTPVDPRSRPAGAGGGDQPAFTGTMACAECHAGPQMGFQFSRWRMSPHARAFAALATPAGYELAREAGVRGSPQEAEQCLACHAPEADEPAHRLLAGFDPTEGVQCESCHGAGSAYSAEAIMRDPAAATQNGLQAVSEETCLGCHGDAHGKPFDYQSALEKIAHPTRLERTALGPRYKTPLNLALSPDGEELYVACEASSSVIIIDAASRRVTGEIAVGRQATDVVFSPDGRRAFVSNRLDDSVSVIDVEARAVVDTLAVGDEPHGVMLDAKGRLLYVLNTSSDSVSVFDAETLEELRRLPASRAPWALARSPDGALIAATNTLSRFVPFRETSVSEVTLIDAARGRVVDRIDVRDANLCMGIAWHPDGRFALITLDRTKNLVPMTRLLQGWTITNGLGIIWRDGRVDQVLLDEPDRCFADPTDVDISPDGRWAFVTSSGTDRVAAVEVEKLISLIEGASDYERERVLPNHLGKPTEFVAAHIPTGRSPRGVVFTSDSRTAFAVNAFDDSVTVIDVDTLSVEDTIDLGGSKEIDQVRWGERLFHSADITFHRQFSCHTCHPDGHVDGITYDIEPDGIGVSPVDNRTLRGIFDTAPFKWEGTNPSLERQCGPRLAVFFTRIDPFEPDELAALTEYIRTIPRPPNRYRPLGGELTAAQRRGRTAFMRTRTNDGRLIPPEQRCVTCHFPPLYTDREVHDVGTKMPTDRDAEFDVPHLNNIYDSAPYLHNGISETLEEIWTRYNPYDQHGVTNDMTKDQLNDLIEYIKTL